MEQLLQSILDAPEWVQVFTLWAVLSAPLNLFGMVLLYRMKKAEMRDALSEDKMRNIAHAQARSLLQSWSNGDGLSRGGL